MTLSLRAETNRKGVRRVVIDCNAAIPGRVANDLYDGIHVDPNGSTPVSAHLVVQCPQLAAMADAAVPEVSGLLGLVLSKMLPSIVAVATNESVPAASPVFSDSEGLLARALCGASELDVVSGSYGTAQG
jgi:hypothetical protein